MSLTYLKGIRTKTRKKVEAALASAFSAIDSAKAADQSSDVARLLLELDVQKDLLETVLSKFESSLEKLSLAIAALTDEDAKQKEEAELLAAVDFSSDADAVLLQMAETRSSLGRAQTAAQSSSPSPDSSSDSVLRDILDRLTGHVTAQPPSGTGPPARQQATVKPPTLQIPTFSGDPLKSTAFWDAFNAAVHENASLSAVEKFTYLRGRLTGKALSSLSGVPLTNDNYHVALDLLKGRFGDVQTIVDAHYVALINLPVASTESSSLRTLYDTMEQQFRSLQALGQDLEQSVFVSMITSKLPQESLFQMELQKDKETPWTANNLRKVLSSLITATEAA